MEERAAQVGRQSLAEIALAAALVLGAGCRTRLSGDDSSPTLPDLAMPQKPLPACAGLRSISPWPMYRADARHTGRGRWEGPGGAHVLWTLGIGPKRAAPDWNTSPVLGPDGAVYVVDATGGVTAVAPDGRVEWNLPGPAGWQRGVYTPAVDASGRLFVESLEDAKGACELRALRAETGAELWRAPTACGLGITLSNDGALYVGNAALDAATGAIKWSVKTDNGASSVPALSDDCTVYIAADHVYAVDHASGAIKWISADAAYALGDSPAIGEEGTVFIGGYRGDLLAIDPSTGKTLWKRSTGSQIRADVAIGADGTVFFSSEATPDRPVTALDPRTGDARWSTSMAHWSEASSPVVDADGTVYFGTGSGIRLFALDGASGEERYHVQMATESMHGPILGMGGSLIDYASGTLTMVSP
jgi:outer membrane protein assembly factor BamB